MRYGIYAFTGTGNTRKVCRRLADELVALGHAADLHLIRTEELPDPSKYDVLIVGYPVHAFNAPEPLLEYLKKMPRLPKGEKKSAYLVRVSGEPLGLNHASGILPKRILKRKGYQTVGEFAYVMPYNIIFRHSDGMAARMQRAEEIKAPEDAKTISEGGGVLVKNGPFRRLVAFVLRIEHTAMPIIGKHFKTTDACISCGKCTKLCPRGNIQIKDGKVTFGKSCVGCMACAFGCPEDAIKTSLLNGWRVNGSYRFDGEPAKDDEVCDYCRKAYLKYFRSVENSILGETCHPER